MAISLIARFSEHAGWYDINDDDFKVTFIATTSKGSYFSIVTQGKASQIREGRQKFKEAVAKFMCEGIDPGEIDLHA